MPFNNAGFGLKIKDDLILETGYPRIGCESGILNNRAGALVPYMLRLVPLLHHAFPVFKTPHSTYLPGSAVTEGLTQAKSNTGKNLLIIRMHALKAVSRR
jgi:hypothetical protein